jgi:hypothetical protein
VSDTIILGDDRSLLQIMLDLEAAGCRCTPIGDTIECECDACAQSGTKSMKTTTRLDGPRQAVTEEAALKRLLAQGKSLVRTLQGT